MSEKKDKDGIIDNVVDIIEDAVDILDIFF